MVLLVRDKNVMQITTIKSFPRVDNPIFVLVKKCNMLLKNTQVAAVMSRCSHGMVCVWSSQGSWKI